MSASRLSRRQMLKLMLVSGSAAMLPAALLTQTARMRAQGESVLIVGAGVAGLTAGRMLHDAGYSVILLEGRDRFGGRVWTNRTLDGLALDLGASWIHGTEDNPLTELADGASIERVITDYDNMIMYRSDGSVVSDDESDATDELFEALMERVAEIAEASDTTISLGDAIQQARIEMDDDLDDKQRKALDFMVNTSIEHEFAADVFKLSAVYWNSDEEFEGEDVVFPNGYDWLPRLLSEGLDIRLNTIVSEISYGEDSVEITAGDATFEADYAIVTLPVGVLKANVVTFNPPLPEHKQQAIANLYVGVLNKLYLRFPDVFWDSDVFAVDFIPDERGQWSDFLNFSDVVGQPVLLAFNAGEYGLAIEELSDEEVVAAAMRRLRMIYGSEIPEPIGYLRTRWSKDPFAFGSYSSYGVNATPDDRAALAEPLNGVLFFAGEATHPNFPSTVHGALMSGQRAAEELLEIE
jgi:monoamine oxidase